MKPTIIKPYIIVQYRTASGIGECILQTASMGCHTEKRVIQWLWSRGTPGVVLSMECMSEKDAEAWSKTLGGGA